MGESNNPEMNVTRIALCGTQGCCPKVEIHHSSDKVVITDDNGGKATLTMKQWREAVDKARVGA